MLKSNTFEHCEVPMDVDKKVFTCADYSKDYIINGLQAIPGGFFIYKADWKEEKILYANKALLELLECENDNEFLELTGGTFKGLVYPDDYEEVEASIRMQVNDSDDQFDQVHYRATTKTGKIIDIEDIARLREDPIEGPLFYVFVSTVKAKVDSLTGLPNRTYFMKLAEEGCKDLIQQKLNPVIIAFDFNGMKTFTSRYGVDEGDRFILAFTGILKKYFERKNCSRFAEDHFYVFASADGIEVVLNQIISELHSANGGRTLSVRIGLTNYVPTMSIGEICDRAKIASDTLGGALESDYVWFDENKSQKLLSREYILHHLNQAIAERWIEPYYQPIVRILNDRVCGFEALARWDDPKYGIIPPADFIPILEENGLSYILDMYMVGRVVSMLKNRIESGLPVVPVAINISKSDFYSCDPVTIISTICDSNEVFRNLINIEITETALMADRGLIRNAIDRFHESGFEVSLDDFGAGYSSLNILKDFNFNRIKVDMGYLRDLNDKAKQIITMMVRMAKSLGIHTLAEGVESKEQTEFLTRIGCECIQGYYHGKPMPLDNILQQLRETGKIFEVRDKYVFYQKAGLCDVISDSPFAMYYYDSNIITLLYANDEYNNAIEFIDSFKPLSIGKDININQSFFIKKLCKAADKAIQENNDKSLYLNSNNKYYKVTLTPLVISDKCSVLSGTIGEIDFETYRFKDRIIIPESEDKGLDISLQSDRIKKEVQLVLKNEEVKTSEIKEGSENGNVDWIKSFLQSGNIKMFWKDRNRRFVGASSAFLNYYGFRSIDEILGKTDEDLAWHIDDMPYKTDEIHVIERGERVLSAYGKVIVDGVPRGILTNKFPVFQEGKIVGLIGYFVDIEEDIRTDDQEKNNNLVDQLTGLLNAQGMMLNMLDFGTNLKSNGQDYSYVYIFIDGYNEVLTDYGEEVAKKLIKLVARTIKKCFKSTATIARSYGCYFSVCEKGTSTDEISKEVSKCVDAIKEIKEVDKCRCSISMTYGIATGSEASNVQTVFDIAHKRQEINIRKNGMDPVSINTEILPSIYSDLPLPYVVLKPVIDEQDESIIDMKFLFVNQKYCEITGISKKDLLGRGYMETFPRTDHTWIEYTYRAVRGEYVHNKLYDGATKHWMQFTAAPSVVPGTCAVVFEVIDSEQKNEADLAAGKETMEAVFNFAKILDRDDYETSINNALGYIGAVTGAKRVYIFETDKKTFSNTFEWIDNGIKFDKDDHQYKDYRYISLWEKLLQNDTSVVIENVNLLRFDYPDLYNFLRSRGINWLVSAPIYYRGNLVGYLGADNYDRDKNINIRKFIETAAYYLSARLKLNEMYETCKKYDAQNDNLDREALTLKMTDEILSELRMSDFRCAVTSSLQKIGELMNPDRVYIMEINGDSITDINEWCNDGIESLIDERKAMDSSSYLGIRYDMFNIGSIIMVEDIEDIRDIAAEKYKLLKGKDISRYIEIPFFDQGKLVGIIGMDNFVYSTAYDTRKIMETVTFCIGNELVCNNLRLKHAKQSMAKLKNHDENRMMEQAADCAFNPMQMYKDIEVPSVIVRLIFNEDGSMADDFVFISANDAYCRLYNVLREDLIGKKYHEIIHDGDPQLVSTAYGVVINGTIIRERRFISSLQKWYDSLIAPSVQAGHCMIMLLKEDEKTVKDSLTQNNMKSDHVSEILIKVAENLKREKDDDLAIKNVLEELGNYIKADHIYIMMIDHNKTTFSERYEWCRDGVRSNLGMLQRVDINFINRSSAFKHGNYLYDDVNMIKDVDFVLYEFLVARNIRNTIQIPLSRGDEVIGYFGADNIDDHSEEVVNILTTVSFLIEARLVVGKLYMFDII